MTSQPPIEASPQPQGFLMTHDRFISRLREMLRIYDYHKVENVFQFVCLFNGSEPGWMHTMHESENIMSDFRQQVLLQSQRPMYNDNRQINLNGNDATYNENPNSSP